MLLLLACRAEPSDPSRDAMALVQRWAAAFNESNVDGIVSLYAPDALFFGTGSKALVTTPEGIRSYFETGLNRDKPRGAQLLEHSVQVVSDDVVVVTGKDRVSGTKDGSVYHVEGRVSFVLQKLFGYSRDEADRLMMQVHTEGKAVVSNGTRAEAERDVFRLHEHGLWATMQQD